MKKLLIFMCCAFVYNFTYATKTFQGELTTIEFNNLDKKTITFSSMMGYNGACKISYYSKGSKVLVKNHSLCYSILLNPDNQTATYYCELLKEGISINYMEYWNLFATFSNKKRVIKAGILFKMPMTMPHNKIYDFNTIVDTLTAFGHKSRFIKGRIENQYAGTDIDIEIIPSLKMSHALNVALVYGTQVDGLPVKFRWNQNNSGGILGRMKSYQGIEIIELNENPINDNIFEIPDFIKIKKKGVGNIHGFLKKVGKYLKKNNLYPNQRNQEVTYELDESKWTY